MESIVTLAERAPPGSAFMPLSLMHRRILPLLASDEEAADLNSKVARSMRDWGRSRGEFVRFAWVPDFERFRGLHGHGLLIAPHRLALAARKFFRKAVARHAKVKALPSRTLQFETRRGPVQEAQATGFLRYCAGKAVNQGEEVAGVKGRANPDRPIRSRRCGLPRVPAPAKGAAAPPSSTPTHPADTLAAPSTPTRTASTARAKRTSRTVAPLPEVVCAAKVKTGAKLRRESGGTPDAACVAVIATDDPRSNDADAGGFGYGLPTGTSSAPFKHAHPRAEGPPSTPRGTPCRY